MLVEAPRTAPGVLSRTIAMSKAIFDKISEAVKSRGEELVKMGGAIFQLVVSDEGLDGKVYVDLKSGTGECGFSVQERADVSITVADADLVATAEG